MKPNWTQIAGIVTNAAVVIGLVLVWVELQQNSTQMQVDSLNSRIDTRISIWIDRASNEVWRSGNNKVRQMRNYNCSLARMESITPIELGILNDFLSAEMLYWQNIYYQRELGVVDPDQVRVLDMIPTLTWRPYRESWRSNVQGIDALPPEFEQHVSELVDQMDADLEALLAEQRAQGIEDPYGGDLPPCIN